MTQDNRPISRLSERVDDLLRALGRMPDLERVIVAMRVHEQVASEIGLDFPGAVDVLAGAGGSGMTLIFITTDHDQAQILTDSAAYSPNMRHLQTTTKVSHLHHLDTAMVCAGFQPFGSLARFAIDTDDRLSAAPNLDVLVAALPFVLPALWAEYAKGLNAPGPAVLFLVGWSPAAGRFVTYELGADDGFAPTVVDGTFLHPTPWWLKPSDREFRLLLEAYESLGAEQAIIDEIRQKWPASPTPAAGMTADDLVELAKKTRENRSMGGGITIHGDLVLTTLEHGATSTRTMWTFPDHGEDFDRLIQGSDHPAAQVADCWCGSGQPVMSCCRASDLDKPCRCFSGELFKDCCITPEAAVELFRVGRL